MPHDEVTERDIQASGGDAPRITPAHVESRVLAEQYHVFVGTCLTVCALTLMNGFQVVGQAACAHPDNFDADLGKRIARRNALDKVFELEAYLLRQRLHDGAQTERG